MLYEVKGKCPCCGARTSVMVDFDEYQDYLEGRPIKYALPSLSYFEKGTIISGICEECAEENEIPFDDVDF